jgi:hypothetical protein
MPGAGIHQKPVPKTRLPQSVNCGPAGARVRAVAAGRAARASAAPGGQSITPPGPRPVVSRNPPAPRPPGPVGPRPRALPAGAGRRPEGPGANRLGADAASGLASCGRYGINRHRTAKGSPALPSARGVSPPALHRFLPRPRPFFHRLSTGPGPAVHRPSPALGVAFWRLSTACPPPVLRPSTASALLTPPGWAKAAGFSTASPPGLPRHSPAPGPGFPPSLPLRGAFFHRGSPAANPLARGGALGLPWRPEVHSAP